MKDLMPVHLSKRSIPMVDPNVASVPAGIVARPRKDMFIIPSLTPEDAKKGELPKDPNIRWGKEAQKKLTGNSAYVTAEESWFTNLAHMHGDRSLGNGKYGNIYQDPSIANDLPMFIIDFSDRLTQTDATADRFAAQRCPNGKRRDAKGSCEAVSAKHAAAIYLQRGTKNIHVPSL